MARRVATLLTARIVVVGGYHEHDNVVELRFISPLLNLLSRLIIELIPLLSMVAKMEESREAEFYKDPCC